jgi:hypothetical protein
MKKLKKPVNVLEELIKNREENILLLSKWTDKDLDEMTKRYREAKDIAFEENRFESYKILEEKLSLIRAAKDFKFGLTEEAGEWLQL